MSAEIVSATGITATLIPGGGGVFDVIQDGKRLFCKHDTHRFPEPGEISQLLAS
ncbi:MAG: Rdx family protein [Proteobacteria bacterium]|nr:Rdx family protein [Pseudomonadota bacterium]